MYSSLSQLRPASTLQFSLRNTALPLHANRSKKERIKEELNEERKEERKEGQTGLAHSCSDFWFVPLQPWPRGWSGRLDTRPLAPQLQEEPKFSAATSARCSGSGPKGSSRPSGRALAPAWASQRSRPPTCGPLTFGKDGAHLQVARGESDDGRLVQLRGDGRGQREQLGQLIKLAIFLFPPGLGRILGLLLPRASAPGILDPAVLQAR